MRHPMMILAVLAGAYVLVCLLAFVFQILFTRHIHRKFGVDAGMRVLPSAVVLSGLFFALTLGFLPVASFALVWILKLSETGFRHSIDQATRELLFQPVAEQVRRRAKAFVARAEFTRSPADLDSVRYFLDRCRGLGESGKTARYRINLMMTEAALMEAEWAAEELSAMDMYEQAESWADRARMDLEGQDSALVPQLGTRLLQYEARIGLFRAQALGDTIMLSQADSLLSEALSVLPSERFSFLRTGLLLDRSEVAFARYTITGEIPELKRAQGYLEQGLPFANPAFHPRLARLFAEAGQRYEAAAVNHGSRD